MTETPDFDALTQEAREKLATLPTMTTDEALAFTRRLGWRVWSLNEQTGATPTWRARLWHPELNRRASLLAGFNDAFTDYGCGDTPAEAILHAAKLRVDRKTGLTREVELPQNPPQAAPAKAPERVQAPPAPRTLRDSLSRLGDAVERLTEALR